MNFGTIRKSLPKLYRAFRGLHILSIADERSYSSQPVAKKIVSNSETLILFSGRTLFA